MHQPVIDRRCQSQSGCISTQHTEIQKEKEGTCVRTPISTGSKLGLYGRNLGMHMMYVVLELVWYFIWLFDFAFLFCTSYSYSYSLFTMLQPAKIVRPSNMVRRSACIPGDDNDSSGTGTHVPPRPHPLNHRDFFLLRTESDSDRLRPFRSQ